MENKDSQKWYFRTWSLIVSFLVLGPFMLPLVIANPRFSTKVKIVITLLIIAATFLMSAVFVKSLKAISNYYQLLQSQI